MSDFKFLNLGPEVIKLFSCSTQLSTIVQLLIKTKILTNEAVSCFKGDGNPSDNYILYERS